MRIPGAAILIAVGLLVLWVATTGQWDNVGAAWHVLKGDADTTGVPVASNSMGSAGAPSVGVTGGIMHDESWHTNAMALALQPSVALFNPGGFT